MKTNVVPSSHYYFECIEREECLSQVYHQWAMARWERIILEACGLDGINWNCNSDEDEDDEED